MSDDTRNALCDRLKSLEEALQVLRRRARWWKRLGSVSAVCLIALTSAGAERADIQKVVESQMFTLRDTSGRVRAQLRMDPVHKQPSLTLISAENKIKVAMTLDQNGSPSLVLFGTDDRSFASMEMGKDGNEPQIRLRSGTLNSITLRAMTDGSNQLYFSDKNDKPRFGVIDRDGAVGLTLLGKNALPQVRLAVKPDGAPELALIDENGKVLFHAPKP